MLATSCFSNLTPINSLALNRNIRFSLLFVDECSLACVQLDHSLDDDSTFGDPIDCLVENMELELVWQLPKQWHLIWSDGIGSPTDRISIGTKCVVWKPVSRSHAGRCMLWWWRETRRIKEGGVNQGQVEWSWLSKIFGFHQLRRNSKVARAEKVERTREELT